MELAKTYDPKGLEDRLYQKWLDGGYFRAEVNPNKKPFTIVMPPPNITGQLHMGHVEYRMIGFDMFEEMNNNIQEETV